MEWLDPLGSGYPAGRVDFDVDRPLARAEPVLVQFMVFHAWFVVGR
jgi:hypothetical protein